MLSRMLRYCCIFCLKSSVVADSSAGRADEIVEDPDPAATDFRYRTLGAGLHLLQGSGGNLLVVEGEEGLLLIDADFAAAYPRAREALTALGLGSRRVELLIDTHFHHDHSDGNHAWAGEGAVILAHENVRSRLASGALVRIGPYDIEMEPAVAAALPTETFASQLQLQFGRHHVRLVHQPAAHTDGDAVIFVGDVVHMGDIYVRYGFPFIDVPAGGTIDGMIRACREVLRQIPLHAQVVPGHGEPAGPQELLMYVQMIEGARDAVAGAKRAGATLPEIQSAGVLAQWAESCANPWVTPELFVEYIYSTLPDGA
jgi:glyoxylase-like metal-dependent hydrolase (beta-lactamase superfamily II)